MLFSSSNRLCASAFASSVLPTPVGPRNKKEPIGFVGSLIPALERMIASVTSSTPSSWPMTRLCSSSARWSVLFLSLSFSFATGIPVHLETIFAISSSVTDSCTRARSFAFTFASSSSSCFCSCGRRPYWSSAALFRSYSLWAFWISLFTCSICSRIFCTCSTEFFSFSHCTFLLAYCAFSSASSSCKCSRRSLLKRSSSFLSADSSISICITRRRSSSSSVGIESSSVLINAHASSTRSIALSGRKRSEIYLFESVTAATSALSVILTPWKTSYLSFSPLRIEIASSTVGSSTRTGWKRRSKAASFSIYWRYSSSVVAPIQCSSPLASIGLSIFPASIAPSVLPAPTIVWSSSIKRMIFPSLFFTSSRTAFRRSSNSPRYFAPATSAPISSEKMVLSFKPSGTSPLTILWASPSTTAVLPTPGSPISTGLFFVLRDRIRITLRISSSRPMTGSSFWSLAFSTRSWPYLFNVS